MPAAGRSCRQSVRHSVRLSDLRRRRRLLSPDARGPPSAARSSRGPARRRAPPPPGPTLPPPPPFCLCVRPSVRRPLALRSSCPAASLPARAPAPPALSPPARCLFVSALALPPGPSLAPRSLVPSQSPPLLSASLSGCLHPLGVPRRATPDLLEWSPSEHSVLHQAASSFQHILWGSSLQSVSQSVESCL